MFFKFLVIFLCFEAFETCGRFSYGGGTIVGGEFIKKGEWPWLVALFESKSRSYFCGGTLISEKHVLTAAHCLNQKYNDAILGPNEFYASLGRFNISSNEETEALTVRIQKLKIHPHWNPYEPKYDADLAILTLGISVALTNYINIVCLPSFEDEYNALVGDGVVVGWGASDRTNFERPEDVAKQVTISAITNEMCFLETQSLAGLSSLRTFCAGGDLLGVCSGDSGGGFFTHSGSTWTIRGIISASLFNAIRQCDISRYSIYTNVSKFMKWIRETIDGDSRSAVNIDIAERNRFIELGCEYLNFYNEGSRFYTCKVKNLTVTQPGISIKNTIGIQQDSKTNNNIGRVDIDSEKAVYLPSGIGQQFKSLQEFFVWFCDLKFVKRENFKDMNELIRLDIVYNQVVDIPEDTFWDLPRLEGLWLQENKIKVLPKKIFKNLVNLKFIAAEGNELEELDRELFRNNPRLEKLYIGKNKIISIGIDVLQFKEIDFSNNKCIDVEYNNNTQWCANSKCAKGIDDLKSAVYKNCSYHELLNRHVFT